MDFVFFLYIAYGFWFLIFAGPALLAALLLKRFPQLSPMKKAMMVAPYFLLIAQHLLLIMFSWWGSDPQGPNFGRLLYPFLAAFELFAISFVHLLWFLKNGAMVLSTRGEPER